MDFLINDPPAPPYAPIVTPRFFTRENIISLRDSGYVSAIVLINDTRGMESFSTESNCPNQFFTYPKQPTCDANKPETVWNKWGSGLLQENFDIPIIFLSSQDEFEKVINCSKKFNTKIEGQESRSLCSIEISSQMAAAGNSEICMRRSKFNGFIRNLRFCDPLSGRNVYGTLFPRQIVSPSNRSSDEREKIILITARLDTTSMFDGIYPGAMDSLASITALVSTAHFLRKIVDNEIYDKNKINVLFVLFNGESYDYIGSQRFVYDLKKNAFPSPSSHTMPINLSNILMMIDLGAIDGFDKLSIYHRLGTDSSSLVDSINFYSNQLNLKLTVKSEITDNIPPVSAQMFLRQNESFPALVLAAKEPMNKFYHSIYDDAKNLNYTYVNSSKDFDELNESGPSSDFSDSSVQVKIRNIATALGLAIYDKITGDPKKYLKNMVASAELVDEIIYCYLISSNCKLFRAAFDHDERNYAPPLQRYVSVNSALGHEVVGWTYRVFGLILSEKVEKPRDNCTTLPYYWLPGSLRKGECRYTTQNFSLALSPAFEEDENYNFSSNYYSTWTESTWNDLSARIFLRPASSHEYFTLTIGIIVFILSFIIVYVVNSKAEVLFGDAVIAEQ